MSNQLYRSRSNKMLGGICGGLGDYLDIDPTFIRIYFVILAMSNGIGFMIYLIMWIIVPIQDRVNEEIQDFDEVNWADRARGMGRELQTAVRHPSPEAFKFIGIALIAMGFFFLVDRLPFMWLKWVSSDILWAVLLIIGGAYLVWRTLEPKGE